jgi:hypothetical protein
MENSFWNCYTGGHFLESFKKSFALYVENGMKKKAEVAINMLENELVESLGFGFEMEFLKIVIDHLLRRFQCLYSHSAGLTTFMIMQPTLRIKLQSDCQYDIVLYVVLEIVICHQAPLLLSLS